MILNILLKSKRCLTKLFYKSSLKEDGVNWISRWTVKIINCLSKLNRDNNTEMKSWQRAFKRDI